MWMVYSAKSRIRNFTEILLLGNNYHPPTLLFSLLYFSRPFCCFWQTSAPTRHLIQLTSTIQTRSSCSGPMGTPPLAPLPASWVWTWLGWDLLVTLSAPSQTSQGLSLPNWSNHPTPPPRVTALLVEVQAVWPVLEGAGGNFSACHPCPSILRVDAAACPIGCFWQPFPTTTTSLLLPPLPLLLLPHDKMGAISISLLVSKFSAMSSNYHLSHWQTDWFWMKLLWIALRGFEVYFQPKAVWNSLCAFVASGRLKFLKAVTFCSKECHKLELIFMEFSFTFSTFSRTTVKMARSLCSKNNLWNCSLSKGLQRCVFFVCTMMMWKEFLFRGSSSLICLTLEQNLRFQNFTLHSSVDICYIKKMQLH